MFSKIRMRCCAVVKEMNRRNKEKKWHTLAINFSRSKSTSLDYLFIKYNRPLPSSAAVKRLFSLDSGILTAKRASLKSRNFQTYLPKRKLGLFEVARDHENVCSRLC